MKFEVQKLNEKLNETIKDHPIDVQLVLELSEKLDQVILQYYK